MHATSLSIRMKFDTGSPYSVTNYQYSCWIYKKVTKYLPTFVNFINSLPKKN